MIDEQFDTRSSRGKMRLMALILLILASLGWWMYAGRLGHGSSAAARVLCELRGKKRKEGKHRRIHHLDSNLSSGVVNGGEAVGGASGSGGVSSRTKSSNDE